MSEPVIPERIVEQKIMASGDILVMGNNVYQISRPENAVRWVVRGGEKILQQCWTVTGHDNGVTYVHQDWRDVPTEPENIDIKLSTDSK